MASYTTLEYIQDEIRATTPFSGSTYPSDDAVNRWITEVSAQIDAISNSTYSRHTVSSELHDYTCTNNTFCLPIDNLLSITKVEYNISGYGITPSWITLNEGVDYDYIVYLPSNEIQFCHGSSSQFQSLPLSGSKRLRLSYTYGATTTPYGIQRLATLMTAKRVVMSMVHYQAGLQSGQVTVGPITVADPSIYSLSYLKSMDNEIQGLISDFAIGFKVFKTTRVYDSNLNINTSGGYYGY